MLPYFPPTRDPYPGEKAIGHFIGFIASVSQAIDRAIMEVHAFDPFHRAADRSVAHTVYRAILDRTGFTGVLGNTSSMMDIPGPGELRDRNDQH